VTRPSLRNFSFDRFATFLLFLAIGTAASLMPAQSDTFWQLRAGQAMVATGRILLEDTFTHTVRGAYWPNHEWLSQVTFYLLHALGGFPLLTAFAALLVVLSWTCVWKLMAGAAAVRLTLVLVLVVPSARLWSLRPQLVSLLLLSLTLLLVQRGRTRLLPVIFVVWSNFHGGVMLGLAALGGALAGEVWADRKRLGSAALTLALCAGAVCVTPLGITVWTEIPHMLERLDAYGVAEWQTASLTDPVNVPFWAAALALVVLTIVKLRTFDRDTALLVGSALALVPLAIESSRNISSFLLIAGPALSRLMLLVTDWAPQRRRRERYAINAGVTALASTACVTTIAIAWAHPFARLNWAPVSASVVSQVSSCPGNIYNLYDNGGYLVWFVPGKPVFMDSRQDPFPRELVTAQIDAERTGRYEALFAKYDVACAAVPPYSRVGKGLTRDGWRVTASDDRWRVLRK
jgi:hypothetical protein